MLFQIRRALGDAADKGKALRLCSACPELMTSFQVATARGQTLARTRLQTHPDEEATLFFLSKLSLNHVWLHLGTLGHKTGWGEYWEARKTLDKLLKQNPGHVRARVARAWIDYIVDTKMPRGTRWLLGGGDKKKGLLAVREAANTEAEFFVQAEARFALWDMQVRERKLPEAVVTARVLARDFPENQELNKFLEAHESHRGANAIDSPFRDTAFNRLRESRRIRMFRHLLMSGSLALTAEPALTGRLIRLMRPWIWRPMKPFGCVL